MMENVRKISKKYYFRQVMACWMVSLMLFGIPAKVVLADPNPGADAHPSTDAYTATLGGIAGTAGNTTTVIAPDGSIFEWNNFDIGSNHTVNIVQGVDDAVLNRVNALDGLATGINGALNADGTVFIVNPRGIVFGPQAYVLARNLVASSLNISDSEWNNVQSTVAMQFTGGGIGDIETKEGSRIKAEAIALIGRNVINRGALIGDFVLLAAGDSVLITGDPETSNVVVEVAMADPALHTVDNGGELGTGTGSITMKNSVDAEIKGVILAAGDIFSTAIEGVEFLRAEAKRDITLNGAITADGDITLLANADVSGIGDVDAEVLTAGGTVEISASDTTINLHDDVTANVDILLNNNTVADDGITLDAGQDVIVGDGAADGTTLTGEGALTVAADRDITLGGDVTAAGDLILDAGDDIYAHGKLTTTDGSMGNINLYVLGGETIHLFGNVTADVTDGGSIFLHNNTQVASDVTLKAGLDVTLDDGKTMTGAGALTIEGDRDITLGGKVTAGGDLTLKADADTINFEPGYTVGGLMWAKGDLKTTNDDIDIYGYNIKLDGVLVEAASDLTLHNDTRAADNLTLKAGNNVESKSHLTALDKLTIEAGDLTSTPGGEMTIHSIGMDTDGSTLTLRQNNKLDLEQNIETWDNRTNTHLVAESTADSVTSEAAAKWKDITATAYEDVILSDISGNITTLNLYAETRDIKITAENGKLYAEGTVDAGRDVIITATDEASDAIFLYDDVDADRDIWLNNNTWAADGVTLDAGQDVRVGYSENLDLYQPKTLTGEGDLTVEADRHITLGGAVAVSDSFGGDLVLRADADIDDDGDMTAYGTIDNPGGSIDIYSSDSTTELYDDVTASVDIKLHNNTWVADAKTLDAGHDVTALETLTGEGVLDVIAGRDVQLKKNVATGDDLTITASRDIKLNQVSGITESAGSMTLNADKDNLVGGDGHVYAHGLLKTTNTLNGNMTIESDCTSYIYAGAESAGEMTIIADYGNNWAPSGWDFGAVSVISGLLKTTNPANGDMTVKAAGDIQLNTTLVSADAAGNMLLEADTGGNGADMRVSGNLLAGGDIDLYSSDNTTYLGGDLVQAAGNVTLHNNTELNGGALQRIDAESGTLWAKGTLTKTGSGDLTLAGDAAIDLDGTVDVEAGSLYIEDDFSATGDLLANDDVTFNGSTVNGILDGTSNQRIDAESGTLWANGTLTKTGSGDLTLAGDAAIDLDGTVEVQDGSLFIEDDFSATGDLLANDDVTFEGSIVNGELDGDIDQTIEATTGTLHATGTLTKTGTGDLTLAGETDIDLDGTVEVQDGSLFIEDDFSAAADLIASENITFEGSIVNATLDGSVDQKIEAENGQFYASGWIHKTGDGNLDIFGGYNGPLGTTWPLNYSVWTHDVIVDNGELTIEGNACVRLEGDIYSLLNMWLTANADGIDSDVEQPGDLPRDYLIHFNPSAGSATIVSEFGDIDMSAQDDVIYLDGGDNMPDAYVSAGGDILLRDWTWVQYSNKLEAGDDIVLAAGEQIHANGSLTLEAVDDIILGVTDVDNHWVNPDVGTAGDVSAARDLTLDAGDDIYAHGELSTTNSGAITATAVDNINLYHTPKSADADGTLTLAAGGNLYAAGSLEGNMSLSGYDVTVDGDVTSHGILDVTAGRNIRLKSNVTSVGNMTIYADDNIYLNQSSGNTESGGNMTLTTDEYDITAYGMLSTTSGGGGAITATAGYDIVLSATPVSAQADGDLTLDADDDIDVEGDLISNNGSIEFSSSDWTTYLAGDVTAAVDVTFNNTTLFDGDDDQKVDAQTGMITANSWLWKDSDWGSLYLEAAGDISLVDAVGASYGGVSIISETGKIFTPDEFGDETDTLNVYIEGYSDQLEGAGVSLPYGPGKAAIVIMSAKDLKLGPDAELVAEGLYNATGAVDDREGVAFLDAPATIGGILRDEGDPFDVAIYVASKSGNVDVSSPVSIGSGEFDEDCEVCEYESKGAMVIDAFDTVTFDGDVPGGLFETSLADGDVGDRLEVVSRRSEWLFQAVGRLPYAGGGGPFPTGYNYVLRGAGADNPSIGNDAPAWVLENPMPAAPLYTEAGEPVEKQEFGEGGCPALMVWLSDEIGVPAEDIQIFIANTFALSTDTQPCEVCARLKNAADILDDDAMTAALTQVVNEFITTPAPPSEEQMASIATAFADHAGDGTYYAAAGEWIDALVTYVSIMTDEMGWSAGDSVAMLLAKHGLPEGTDATVVAYVQSRLAAIGG